MSTQKKIIIIVAILAIVGVIAYFIFFKKSSTPTAVVPLVNPTPGTSKPTDSDAFPINVGSKGDNVKRLQTALNFLAPNSPLTVDGDFGSKTRVKLLTSVAVPLSELPMSEDNLNTIIAKGNANMVTAAAGSVANPNTSDTGSGGGVFDSLFNFLGNN